MTVKCANAAFILFAACYSKEMKTAKGYNKKQRKVVDNLIYGAAILYPAMSLPQIFKIFNSKSANDLSIHSYILFIVFEIIFLFYGLSYKLKPIVVAASLWLVVYVIIIFGILMHGAV